MIHSCTVTFSLLPLLPLPPDDPPAGETVDGEHVVGVVGEHIIGGVGDLHIVGEVLAEAGKGEVGEH